MINPFNAAIAARETLRASVAYKETKRTLIDAYLTIAEAHITRSCLQARSRAWVYLPSEISREVVDILTESGFTVTRHTTNRSIFIISWEEA